jgi:hypothetical protein
MIESTAFTHLLDDASVFPPGNAPVEAALPAHRAHRASPYSDFVGPLVVPSSRLKELSTALERDPGPPSELAISLTLPEGTSSVSRALEQAGKTRGISVVGLEIAIPPDQASAEFVANLERAVGLVAEMGVYVELPRDGRRPGLIGALAATRFKAKIRLGGTNAEAHPGELEVATAISQLNEASLAWKATAGLHHAVRNTDPNSRFEQHGFINVMLAAHQALAGADVGDLQSVLSQRDSRRLAADFSAMSAAEAAALRLRFRSFGTCSISDPLEDLVALDLAPRSVLSSSPGNEPVHE